MGEWASWLLDLFDLFDLPVESACLAYGRFDGNITGLLLGRSTSFSLSLGHGFKKGNDRGSRDPQRFQESWCSSLALGREVSVLDAFGSCRFEYLW